MELLPVFFKIRIINLAVDSAFLIGSRKNNVVIWTAFIRKTNAVAVDFHERLRPWIPLRDGSREVLCAIGSNDIAGIHARCYCAAVK